MELKFIVNIILKRFQLVILLPIVLSGIAGFYSLINYIPQYEARTTLYVMSKSYTRQQSSMYEDLQITQFLVNDYRELIKSRMITGAIVDELKLKGIDPGQLASRISVLAKEGTRIIVISVIHENPEMARNIANKAGEVFAERAVDVMNVDNVETIDEALTPTFPINSQSYKYVILAFVFGIAAAITIILFLEYIDDTVKTREDIQKHLGIKVLGIIPEFKGFH